MSTGERHEHTKMTVGGLYSHHGGEFVADDAARPAELENRLSLSPSLATGRDMEPSERRVTREGTGG